MASDNTNEPPEKDKKIEVIYYTDVMRVKVPQPIPIVFMEQLATTPRKWHDISDLFIGPPTIFKHEKKGYAYCFDYKYYTLSWKEMEFEMRKIRDFRERMVKELERHYKEICDIMKAF